MRRELKIGDLANYWPRLTVVNNKIMKQKTLCNMFKGCFMS